jgi:hypothetical protein
MASRAKSITLFTALFLALFFVVPSLIAALTLTMSQTALPLALLLAVATLWLTRRHLPSVEPLRRYIHKPTA